MAVHQADESDKNGGGVAVPEVGVKVRPRRDAALEERRGNFLRCLHEAAVSVATPTRHESTKINDALTAQERAPR